MVLYKRHPVMSFGALFHSRSTRISY